MSEILVNTIKKADGTGGLTVPSGSGTVATLAGGTFTGDITMSSADLVVGSNSIFIGGTGSANELSDYEEGTWTPNVGGTATYSFQRGSYVKIGKTVHIFGELGINLIGTGSSQFIYGIPFTPAANTAEKISVSYLTGSAASVTSLGFYADDGSGNRLIFAGFGGAQTSISNAMSILQNSASVTFSGTYTSV